MNQLTAALMLSLAVATGGGLQAAGDRLPPSLKFRRAEQAAGGGQVSSVIQGRVTSEDGEPLPGASVVNLETLGGTTASGDGTYKLQVNRDGTYNIRVSFIGFKSVTRVVVVAGTATADFTLIESSVPAAEVVVSATRAGKRTPVTYQTITGEELKKINFGTDIPFLLSMTPSLVETSEAGNGIGYTSMRIRGSDASRINVTIDGIPLNDAESQQVFWVDLPDLASSVESIQVQRGVGTSGNGSGAFGASVNILTASPGNEPAASVTGALGSFNTHKMSVMASTGLMAERISFMMRYTALQSDGYVRHSGSNNKSMFMTGVYSSGKSRLKANVIIGTERTGISWWGVTPEMMAVDRRYNVAGAYTDEEGVEHYYEGQTDNYWQNHYQLIYSRTLSTGLLLQTAAHLTTGEGYYEQYKEDEDRADYGLPPIVGGTETITSTDMIHRKWNDNVFYGVTWALKYEAGKIDAVIGGAVNRHDGDHFGNIEWMKYPGTTEKGFEWYRNNGLKDEFNIYGKLNRMLTDRISAFADFQFRHIDYSMAGPDDNLLELSLNEKYNFFNPKGGLFFSITPKQDVFASVAVANREPTRANFKDAIGDAEAVPMSERLTDYEAGYTFRSSAATLNVNLYYMRYHNQLVPTGELSNVGYPIMTNVKESYRTGVEISGSVKPFDFMLLRGSLTLSRNKIKDFVEYYTDYNTTDWSEQYVSHDLGLVDIAYSPSVITSADLAVEPFKDGTLTFSGKYVGSQYFDNTMSEARKLDPYFVAGITAGYSLKFTGVREVKFQFSVNNLLNSMYISNGYGGNWYEDGVEKTWAYYFPQAGINYMMKINFNF